MRAARTFLDLLVLQNRGFVALSQSSSSGAGGQGDVRITPRPQIFSVKEQGTPHTNYHGAAAEGGTPRGGAREGVRVEGAPVKKRQRQH